MHHLYFFRLLNQYNLFVFLNWTLEVCLLDKNSLFCLLTIITARYFVRDLFTLFKNVFIVNIYIVYFDNLDKYRGVIITWHYAIQTIEILINPNLNRFPFDHLIDLFGVEAFIKFLNLLKRWLIYIPSSTNSLHQLINDILIFFIQFHAGWLFQ